jgi:hydrogenase nickel incorporation protein HypA/HybF
MHEMSLTESIVEIAVETAEREGASRVRRIVVDVGALSAVEPEALLFCFTAVSAGTIAEGATLDINPVPGAGRCADCDKIVPIEERFGPCPECGGFHITMTQGGEMRVKEMEVD